MTNAVSEDGRGAITTIGTRVYSLGVIMLGIVEMAYGAFAEGWLPVPAHIPGYRLLAYASAGLLILAGVAVNVARTAKIAALGLATFFTLWMLALHLPHALAKPAVWVSWQAIAESVAMALGGVLAYTLTFGVAATRAADVGRVARLTFGVCLLVFGVSHFVYAKFTGSLVPTWLPPSQLFWTYATGAAQIAAGLAMLSGVQARLAAILLTVMYAIFGVLVQLAMLIADPSSHENWAENAINLILVGAAWCLAESLSKTRRGASAAAG